MDSTHLSWPSLDEGYTDEFGVIRPEVYRVAGELWPQAERLVHSTLRDYAVGSRLMHKAAAAVSRELQKHPDQILNLKAYLWVAFKRLVSDEVEKENRYQALGPEQQPLNDGASPSETLSDQILLQEVMAQMDSWTRTVFELRVLGYQFEDISRMLKSRPNHLRSKFHKEIKKLRRRLRI